MDKNIIELQEKVKELNGGININKIMQSRAEDTNSFDEEFDWNEIRTEENKGNRFLEIVNDVVAYEKGVTLGEFQLVNDEGKMIYSIKESIFRALSMCFVTGGLWFCLAGKERGVEDFTEGFFWPFICILITSIFGLPLYFLGKKHPKAAATIKKVGMILGGIFVVGLLLFFFGIKFLSRT